jgi:hypothetical protein
MSAGYKATLEDGREIYIPIWDATTGFTNLTTTASIIGIDNLVIISQDDVATVILALATAKDANKAASLLKNAVCEVRIDGDKIMPAAFDELFKDQMYLAAELFNHVMIAQYKDFFGRGLAKVNSPAK